MCIAQLVKARVRDVTARVEESLKFAFIYFFKPAIIPKPYTPWTSFFMRNVGKLWAWKMKTKCLLRAWSDKDFQHVSIKAHCNFSVIFPHSSSRTPLVNLPKRPHYWPESTQFHTKLKKCSTVCARFKHIWVSHV